jgi:hypothetical protein
MLDLPELFGPKEKIVSGAGSTGPLLRDALKFAIRITAKPPQSVNDDHHTQSGL